MFRFIVLLALLASVTASLHDRDHYEAKFIDYLKEKRVNFKFTGKEFLHRLQIFSDNVDMIETHNKGTSSFKMEVNEFTHMTWSEFREHFSMGGTRPPIQNLRAGGKPFVGTSSNPSSVDWTTQGAVTPVKDQGNCGSCWSFATTGSIEGAYKIKYGSLISQSEQNLVDCDVVDSGCNGGWMDRAYGWMKRNGGICTEADYPYTSGTTAKAGSCQTTCTKDSKTAPSDWTDVTPGSVSAMESAVAQQPVAIAVAVNNAFQFYSSGVYSDTCGDDINHGVLTVGYGTDGGMDYWKVKNSWGASWGEDGYIRVLKDDSNLCHVLDAPVFPTL
jgi:C1A family cysteine protease